MGFRRWRPNQYQRRQYAERMREQQQMTFVQSSGAIREGCIVTWVDKTTSDELTGTVIKSSYGAKTGQHTFTIQLSDGSKKMVKGRNLYDRLVEHIQGEKSKQESL